MPCLHWSGKQSIRNGQGSTKTLTLTQRDTHAHMRAHTVDTITPAAAPHSVRKPAGNFAPVSYAKHLCSVLKPVINHPPVEQGMQCRP